MHFSYAYWRRCHNPSRRRIVISSTVGVIGAVLSAGAIVWIIARGSLTGTPLLIALVFPGGVLWGMIFGLVILTLQVRWPRTFRRINRRVRRRHCRLLSVTKWSRYPILLRWRRLRQTSASAWTLRAIAVGASLGLPLTLATALLIFKTLALVPALAPISHSSIIVLRNSPSVMTTLITTPAIAAALIIGDIVLFNVADILADRTARRAAAVQLS